MSVIAKIAVWFWVGAAVAAFGSLLLTAYLVTGPGDGLEGVLFAVALTTAGWAAMLVGIIGKGVELGVRAANDE